MSTTVTTLQVTDELDLATMPRLVSTVDQALQAQPRTLRLDLSTCPFAGVDALDGLASLTTLARSQGTTLVLVGVRPIVSRAIDLLGLDDTLQTSEPAA